MFVVNLHLTGWQCGFQTEKLIGQTSLVKSEAWLDLRYGRQVGENLDKAGEYPLTSGSLPLF